MANGAGIAQRSQSANDAPPLALTQSAVYFANSFLIKLSPRDQKSLRAPRCRRFNFLRKQQNRLRAMRMFEDKPAEAFMSTFFFKFFTQRNFPRGLTIKGPFRILFVRLLYEKFGDSHHEHIHSEREEP
jgi:hypothetical protein